MRGQWKMNKASLTTPFAAAPETEDDLDVCLRLQP